MRLLVDECLVAAELIRRLRHAGHDVVTSVERVGAGASDSDVFNIAKDEQRTILTANCTDFAALHTANSEHAGLLLVYEDGDSRDMTYSDMVAAIDRAVRRNPDGFSSRSIILNHFRKSTA